MNTREIAGAIPIIGTFVAIGTLIKEGFNRIISPTDLKIKKLIQNGKFDELRDYLVGHVSDQTTKQEIASSGTARQLFSYYQNKYSRSDATLRNTAFELIPVVGLIHHLIFRKTLNEPSADDKAAIVAHSAIQSMTLLNRPGDVKEIEAYYLKNGADNDKITSIVNHLFLIHAE